MRIDELSVENFKGFERREFAFHPQFNLIVGVNGTGKTSLLDALSVALGAWQYAGGYNKEVDRRNIDDFEVRLRRIDQGQRPQLEPQTPTGITATGSVLGESGYWRRFKNQLEDKTGIDGSIFFYGKVRGAFEAVKNGEDITLPVIACYGTGRLWLAPGAPGNTQTADRLSRLFAYRDAFHARLSAASLNDWVETEERNAFANMTSVEEAGAALKQAVLGCLEGGRRLWFDAALKQIVVEFEDSKVVPFRNLSDGQRTMLTLVGDIARRILTLNPQYQDAALTETPGVVLIDELDLHLHPRWQRRIIEDLRRTFPKIQFVCTTHSPFLIQSLRSGEELIMLDGQPTADLANMSVEEIALGIMGVSNPQVSLRYEEMKGAARQYFQALDEASSAPKEKLADFKERLADTIAPYADNPAFQAFLEMKRAAKLGE